jgi:sugar lactone lactonase YvrE
MNRQPGCGNPLTRAIGGVGFLVAIFIGGIGIAAAEELFVSKQLTPSNEYTRGIEGPAVNAAGDLFAVNVRRPGTANPDKKGAIGRMKNGATQSELFAVLPNDGVGNGIRFDLQGRMYVADFPNHIVHVFEPGSTTAQTYFSAPPSKPAFNQPNDLAIARDGTLYASDPNFGAGTGRIWRIARRPDGKGDGAIMTSSSPRPQGITNGIDLSPDNRTLYVGESRFNGPPARPARIWSYRIDGITLADEHELAHFADGDVDGLRVDTDGRIFVARPGAGEVVIIVPPGSTGAAHARVPTAGPAPTNLTFGGADGRDVFVTQSDKNNRFIERFRTNRPGREPCLQAAIPGCTPIAP